MCGRFALTDTPEKVAASLGLADLEDFPPRYNIAPTQPIMIITASSPRAPGSNLPDREAMLVRWGFIPAWTKQVEKISLMINARAETASERPAFRTAMRHRRILIPSNGFYEWKQVGKGETQPYFIRPRDGGLLVMGGLLETYAEPGGSEIDTAAILTTHANAELFHIHARMPVIIQPRDFSRWLDCRTQEPREVADLLQPVLPGMLEAIPVSSKVNKVSNSSPDLLDEVEPVERGRTARASPKPKSSDDQLKLF